MNRQRKIPRRVIRRALPTLRWPTGTSTGCGKRGYPDYDTALHAAIVASRKTHQALRIYLCPGCGRHHLTKRRTWEDR